MDTLLLSLRHKMSHVPRMDYICYSHLVTLSLPENTEGREGGVDKEEAAQKI